MHTHKNLVVFDFDGTLADTQELSHQIMNELAESYGFNTISAAKLAELKQKSARDVLRYLAIPWYHIPFVMRDGKRLVGTRIHELKLLPGIKPLLQELATKANIGVVSTNSKNNIAAFFEIHSLPKPLFISADVSIFGKSRRLKGIRRKMGKFLYVGDEIRDVEAAAKAKVPVAAVAWGYNTYQSLQHSKPDWLARNVSEIQQILDSYADQK